MMVSATPRSLVAVASVAVPFGAASESAVKHHLKPADILDTLVAKRAADFHVTSHPVVCLIAALS